MKYLIVGLGNIGNEYQDTRHNIGFKVLDAFAKASNAVFTTQRYGDVATTRVKNKVLTLLKPSTFMNLSGEAVDYWMKKEKIPIENILIIVDDLALPFGAIRIKGKGSDAGHNGLKNIALLLKTESYARLRFGIGNDFPRGMQIEYVLGHFTPEQNETMQQRLDIACDAIKTFCLSGLNFTMNNYNNK
ncbi:MAG: aminoacyl-tRNA hydrolase [Muribaculaceae bacterium]|nr:aminoacyl-tRNA hydrolase [Muribaculaceae bacterium]